MTNAIDHIHQIQQLGGKERTMRIPVQDEHKFWQSMPCAGEIFKYVKEHPDLANSHWGFDTGNCSNDLDRVWASFSCGSVSGWGQDKLHVSASKPDGTWQLSHQVARAA